MSTLADHALTKDADWRRRAAAVIPGGMWGHQDASRLPDGFPQYFARGEGSRIWDIDGNEYIDLMCSYGPIILGHRHPVVDAAAARQLALIDCGNGPAPVVVELAELLVDTVRHADWALFAKNGTDATTVCVTVARATTRRTKVLVAEGAYHGAAPWCTPSPVGVTPEDRANLLSYRYNDLESVAAAAADAGDDLAAVVVSAFRHDVGIDQELPSPEFARGVRRLCDDTGALLVLDDVRAGFRLALGGSWEPVGVDPDLSAWSKAVANGYSLAAVLGNDRCRKAATRIFTTGSFWFSAVSMAASLATINTLKEVDAVNAVTRAGQRLRKGLAAQAVAHGQRLRQTGPPQMPMVLFDDDADVARGRCFTAAAAAAGVYLHPVHNWFLSTAHTDEEIDLALERTDDAFAAVRRALGPA